MGLGEATEGAVSFTHSVHPDTAKFRAKLWKTRRTLHKASRRYCSALATFNMHLVSVH